MNIETVFTLPERAGKRPVFPSYIRNFNKALPQERAPEHRPCNAYPASVLPQSSNAIVAGWD